MELNINELKKTINHSDFPLGLSSGKMGVCICLFLSKGMFKNSTYESFARELLYDILDNIQSVDSIDIKNGLLGIGIGIDYLINNNFIEGDANYILHDADNLVLKTLNPRNDIDFEINTLLDSLYYIAIRLNNKSLQKDYRYLFEETAIEYINKLSYRIDSSFFEESIPFSIENQLSRFLYLISLFYEADFYNSRLDTIMKEVSYKLFSYLPILNSNKLLLLSAMSSIKKYINVENWQKHIDLLKSEFNVDLLIQQEIREKNFSLCNGLAAIILSIKLCKSEFSNEDYEEITKKMLIHLNINNLKRTISNPQPKELSLFYGELGALTVYNIFKV